MCAAQSGNLALIAEPLDPPGHLLLDAPRNRQITDGVRALGILLVILFHVVMAAVVYMSKSGSPTGVDRLVAEFPGALNVAWQALGSEIVFFASGFLLSYLLFRELLRTGAIQIRQFLIRRASRILPLYAVGLLIFVFTRRFELHDYVFNLLFISKIADARTIIPVGWSLEMMIQFYVLLPFLVCLAMRSGRPLTVITALVLGSVAARFAGLVANPAAYETPIWELMYGTRPLPVQEDFYQLLWYRATPFLVGLLLAYLVVHRGTALAEWFRRGRRAGATLGAGVVLIAIGGFLPAHDKNSFLYSLDTQVWLWFWTLQRFVFVCGVAAVLLPCYYAPRGIAVWVADRLAWTGFGVVSRNIYSIYLFHLACIIPAAALVSWSIDRHTLYNVPTLDIALIFAIAAYLSVQLSKVMTRFVELPARDWIRTRFLQPAAARG